MPRWCEAKPREGRMKSAFHLDFAKLIRGIVAAPLTDRVQGQQLGTTK